MENVAKSIRTDPRDCARSFGTISSCPAAAVVSPLMRSLRPGMSTWVALLGSMVKCHTMAAGSALDALSELAAGANVESSFLLQEERRARHIAAATVERTMSRGRIRATRRPGFGKARILRVLPFCLALTEGRALLGCKHMPTQPEILIPIEGMTCGVRRACRSEHCARPLA